MEKCVGLEFLMKIKDLCVTKTEQVDFWGEKNKSELLFKNYNT